MMNKQKICYTLLLLLLSYFTNAQGVMEMGMLLDEEPTTNIFSIRPDQSNYRFEYELPNEGKLKIEFLRLSDWGTQNKITTVAKAAGLQVKNLQDSFKYSSTTKVLEMNIPMDERIISLNYKELPTDKNQLAYKDGSYVQLKTGMDTIRVVRNIGLRTEPIVDSGIIQVQYTFILKDIADIEDLISNTAFLDKIGAKTDSLLDVKRRHWHNQDALHHGLLLSYQETDSSKISVKTLNSSWIAKYLGISVSFGAVVYDNSISPYFEETIAYLVPTRGKLQGFVGLNLSGWGYISQMGYSKDNYYRTYNLEFGMCKKGTNFLQQRTSLLLGLAYVRNEKPMTNFAFNFGINSYLSLGMSAATNFKSKEKQRSLVGIQFKFNL